MPSIGDIIKASPTDSIHYLVLDVKPYADLPANKERMLFLLRLDDGSMRWYDHALYFRRWKKVA